MFVKAIKNNSEYIKPLVNGYKLPYKDEVYSGIATVMLINDEGWVLTCKHVAENVIFADQIMTKYEDIKKELSDLITGRMPGCYPVIDIDREYTEIM